MRWDKQTEEFVKWYRNLYGDTSVATWTWELPTISKAEEKLHKRMRKRKIKSLLGKQWNQPYYHRWGRKDTYLGKIYSELYLWYFPIVKD
jgi:hypothetical protein